MKKLFNNCLLFFLLGAIGAIHAQERTITGVITDQSTDMPVPGVNVVVKGTSIGTASDFDGNYTIKVINDAVLVFSSLGYLPQEVDTKGKSTINVSLVEDAALLDEVVVVGFGTQKKANVTGATSSVDMEDILANRPVTNPIEAIQGAIPGLQITTNSGQPGASGLGINIRGTTSINGGGPLILMNNVPVSVDDINPQDVASITVLKDASATSIYGARAAFGVILITTKTPAKNQPIKFNYSSTFSFMYPEDIPDKASTYDFINAINDFGTNPFWTGQDIPSWVGFLEEYKENPAAYPNGYAELGGLRYPLADTDLMGEWINDLGFTQIHNFNFSGGSDKTSYRISAGYSDEDGIIVTRNDSFRKFNVNASLTTNLSDKLVATTNIIYRNSTRRTPLGSYSDAISFNSFTPASGNYVFEDGTEVPYFTPANMERLKVAPKILNDNLRLFQKLDYAVTKGLNLVGEYTFEKKNLTRTTSDNQILTVNPERFVLNAVDPVNTFFRKENTQTNYNAFNLYGKYSIDLNKHSFNVLAGVNSEENSFETFISQRNNLINVDLPSLSGATGTQTTDDSYGEWSVLGYFGRLNYNFDEKYFLEVSGRYDGSSRFPEGKRFGFFPSFSGGWHLGRESFMQSIDFLSSLKLRGSWGEIGNQNTTSLYPAIPGLGITDFGDTGSVNWLNEETGSRYATLLLPNLVSTSFTWETVQTLNLGFDANFFRNRLAVNFDWFKRQTLDMLAPGAELPGILGANAPLENVADLESKGWEFAASWNDKIGEVNYNIGFSLSDNQSKITKFDNPAGLLGQYYVGQELGEIWGYTTDGYYTNDDFEAGTLNMDPSSPNYLTGGTLKEGIPRWEGRNQNPGDIKYIDQNGDGIINFGNNTLSNPGDRSVIGNSTRRYQYGFFGNVTYKNFDFSFLANGVGKRDLYINNRVRFPYIDEFSVVYQSQLDYWTPENTEGFFPRNYPLGGVNYGISRSTQTKYLVNGAYLRIKNLTLGYSIPQEILKKNKIDKLRIYIAGENLFSINDYPDGINTELAIQGSGGIYPYLKNYSIGLNLTF
ncbi:TonB-linked outer membrane protein, SusC/RagA family [Arenibacter nanhaiticus]|uniref:TonB-linked outer membrane protein, SusC/RagA family n=1 Tax=Arenibacter nanhaiticus TaxID=558155 RepID=A0A1M6C5I5_9FLAO|nr:TonB-dependent receptor [Arenibacter nanhaiticus]SHI56193.1 TonB-linked outer membrane protein, SusC/RagA family [Arenibacter nanhaiticus]